MSTATDVAPPVSTQTSHSQIAGFLELMHLRSDCTPPGSVRSGTRYFRSWPLTVSMPSHPDKPRFGTVLYDASDTGIGFLSHLKIEPGAIVHIGLFWHDDNAPLVPAVVRHTTTHNDSYVIGCEYVLEKAPRVAHGQDSGICEPAMT